MIFITCGTNLEPLLLEELKELGITGRIGFRGVYIPQTMENVYLVNYRSRLATRVLWPLSQFPCRDRQQLYNEAKKIDWSQYLTAQKTFAIDANVTHPNLRNSLFAALVVKDAICDQLRDKSGLRPSIDVQNPDVQLHLFIQNGQATISLDTSGTPLYKRGWRKNSVLAPLQESIAAAILRWSKYKAEDILLDPMCGSGTILIEAAMIATNTPPGAFRKNWGFFHMPQHSEASWLGICRAANQLTVPLARGKIFGADRDSKAVAITKIHAEALGFPIEVTHREIGKFEPLVTPTLIVTNPPYGKRLDQIAYGDLAVFLRKYRCRAAILAPERRLLGSAYIKQTLPLVNGGLKVGVFAL